MRIPLPKMMRHWREREFERHLSPATARCGLGRVGLVRPPAAALPVRHAPGDARFSAISAGARGRFRRLPLAGGWTGHRDLPAPQGQTFQEMWAAAEDGIMSARDAVLGKIRRSLGVTGEESSRNAAVDDRLRAAPARRRFRRAASFRRRSGWPCSREMAETVSASVARVADPAGVPAAVADYLRGHNLPAAVRMGDDPQSRRHAVGQDPDRGDEGPIRRQRRGLGLPCRRRRRRDRNAGPHLGQGQSDDAQLPARDRNRRARRRRRRRRLRDACGTGCASATARAPCRARSTMSPARRARATSSRRIILGAHGPRSLHIVVVG